MKKETIAGLVTVGIGAFIFSIGKRESDVKEHDILNPPSDTPEDVPDIRRRIVAAAVGELGRQDASKYWNDVLPDHPGFHGDWCGGFALWAIHQGSIADGINWEIGRGFCYRLPQTKTPKPGDIAYIEHPFQHHAVVESINPAAGTVTTIDGNQPGQTVQRRTRPISAITAFFSIEPFILASQPVA